MMLNSSVQSTASDQLIIDESVNSVKSSDAIETTMIENTDEDFQPVRGKHNEKRKASGDQTGSTKEKRPKTQEFVVYVKGTTTNISKRHPKLLQQNIIKDFGMGIKAQIAGDSLRLTCPNELTKLMILDCKFLGNDPIVATKPRFETNEKSSKTKVIINDVDEDIDLEELVEDNQHTGLVTAQRLFARAEGLKYATTTVLLEFSKDTGTSGSCFMRN